jgi:hypothetical protein
MCVLVLITQIIININKKGWGGGIPVWATYA